MSRTGPSVLGVAINGAITGTRTADRFDLVPDNRWGWQADYPSYLHSSDGKSASPRYTNVRSSLIHRAFGAVNRF